MSNTMSNTEIHGFDPNKFIPKTTNPIMRLMIIRLFLVKKKIINIINHRVVQEQQLLMQLLVKLTNIK